MDVTEKWGDDVESAVQLALKDLKLTREEVEVEVLEEPSRGFFGIGSKLAKVRVSKIQKEEPVVEPKKDLAQEVAPTTEASTTASASTVSDASQSQKKTDKKKRNNTKKKPSKKDEPVQRNPRLEELDFHAIMDPLPVVEEHPAKAFLEEVTEQMGLDINMVVKADDSNVYVDIQGRDSGTIIGKRGATLDAIQYLTSLVVNKNNSGYTKVVIDAENYRSKRERTLEQLANRLAGKVVRNRSSVKLEPMNPYERKVIHATLQDNPHVTTRSEGQDPYRRVVIELK